MPVGGGEAGCLGTVRVRFTLRRRAARAGDGRAADFQCHPAVAICGRTSGAMCRR